MKTNNIKNLMAAIVLPFSFFKKNLTFYLFTCLYFLIVIISLIYGNFTLYLESLGSIIDIKYEFWNVTEFSIILDLFIL